MKGAAGIKSFFLLSVLCGGARGSHDERFISSWAFADMVLLACLSRVHRLRALELTIIGGLAPTF